MNDRRIDHKMNRQSDTHNDNAIAKAIGLSTKNLVSFSIEFEVGCPTVVTAEYELPETGTEPLAKRFESYTLGKRIDE